MILKNTNYLKKKGLVNGSRLFQNNSCTRYDQKLPFFEKEIQIFSVYHVDEQKLFIKLNFGETVGEISVI